MPGKIRKKEIVAKITMGRGGGTPKFTGRGRLEFQRKREFFERTLSPAKFKSFVQINQQILSARQTSVPGTLTNRKGEDRSGQGGTDPERPDQ